MHVWHGSYSNSSSTGTIVGARAEGSKVASTLHVKTPHIYKKIAHPLRVLLLPLTKSVGVCVFEWFLGEANIHRQDRGGHTGRRGAAGAGHG